MLHTASDTPSQVDNRFGRLQQPPTPRSPSLSRSPASHPTFCRGRHLCLGFICRPHTTRQMHATGQKQPQQTPQPLAKNHSGASAVLTSRRGSRQTGGSTRLCLLHTTAIGAERCAASPEQKIQQMPHGALFDVGPSLNNTPLRQALLLPADKSCPDTYDTAPGQSWVLGPGTQNNTQLNSSPPICQY